MKAKLCFFILPALFITSFVSAQNSLNKTPEWTSSADGVLPGLLNNLQLQVNTLYGYTVTGLGDINNDGYDDVAISAPGMANIIAGAGNLANVGAVFIYLGSNAGLPSTPSKILQPTTAVAGALFGMSVDAGDITGDNIPDIIISAPMDTYQTTASGLFGDVNVNVTAGKVYIYRSEDLFAASNPSPFLELRLQGHNFFSTGVLGLLDNTSVNALFGYSVAVTDDLNGDNKKDIVIGAPAYLGTSAVSVQSGAAFVYYSNNLSTTAPVKLNVPTPSVLGLITLPLANMDGLLYGFSVDGVGDYNNDGYPDVIVGAPAGINLSSLGGIFSGQVLGGSAYVYYGNGAGVNATIGASLQGPSSGLLSNAANLFGYKVKGVRDAAGQHNGNILISTTSASVISNVVGGLKLKAGAVNVFVKKTSAFSSPVSPSQSLLSPRSSSVLSVLSGQSLDASLLFGAGMDNTRDLNCDSYSDIIIGEPLSTSVPVIGADVTGGAAYIYLGKADGTYQATPTWKVNPEVTPLIGLNTTALVGYSVAGAGYTKGSSQRARVMAGGPANSWDFGSGLLDMGNTMSTLYDFTFDNNGIGKAYTFDPDLCSLTTLPVSLTLFNGTAINKSALLKWYSENEQNFSHYELQRSNDGVNFTTISMVFAKNMQHNDYSYPDKDAKTGVNYYRLKMVDNDSKFTYSSIVVIRFEKLLPGSMTVMPNPVRSDFNIKIKEVKPGTYYVKLFNDYGRLVTIKSINITQTEEVISMPSVKILPNGAYYLTLLDDSGKKISDAKLVVFKD